MPEARGAGMEAGAGGGTTGSDGAGHGLGGGVRAVSEKLTSFFLLKDLVTLLQGVLARIIFPTLRQTNSLTIDLL